MPPISMRQAAAALQALEARGLRSTLLGIGPMSAIVIEATLRLAKERDFPAMFIASRNQVDSAEFGRGYVRGWDQADFVGAVRQVAARIGFDGLCWICRDHGGPWQRDQERAARLPAAEAMDIAKRSFVADLEVGFDLLHVDPTKDPHAGAVVPIDLVLERTVELIAHVEAARARLGLPEVAYEVGTEETSGGLTSADAYASFIERLVEALRGRGLPAPVYIVGQTGTLTRLTENVGRFDAEAAGKLSSIARAYGVGLKEHNGDYLPDALLAMHPGLGVAAMNVAPEFGVAETAAWLSLARAEAGFARLGQVARPSSFDRVLREETVRAGRWRKWMVGADTEKDAEAALADEALADLITRVGGHYSFDLPPVAAERERMEANLAPCGIEPERWVVDAVKRSINRYVGCFGLEGLTGKIKAAAGGGR